MTNLPEAALAREAELCYLTVAMVTDFDAWHGERDAVDVAQVIKMIHANADNARRLVEAVAALPAARDSCPHGCDRALDHGILTPPGLRPAATVERLRAVAGRVLGG